MFRFGTGALRITRKDIKDFACCGIESFMSIAKPWFLADSVHDQCPFSV